MKNEFFDEDLIEEYYPEASPYMLPPMKVWSLPKNKEDSFTEICLSNDYFLTEKIDGSWYQLVQTKYHTYLFGRTTSKETGLLTEKGNRVPHIIQAFDCLPEGTVLIGEIYYPNKSSKDVTTIMGCLPEKAIARQKDNPIHYYVHDIIFYNGKDLRNKGAEERYDILFDIWFKHNLDKFDFLKLAIKYDHGEMFERLLKDILDKGKEGIVLKKKDFPYICDKRPAWSTIKKKQTDTIDLVCTRLIDATKEYTGKDLDIWEYWIDNEPVTKGFYYGWKTSIGIGAYNEKGELIELGTVASGFTDVDRENMAKNPDEYLYSVVSLKCMSISKEDKTLRHPVFVQWRPDKNEMDCKMEEIFI